MAIQAPHPVSPILPVAALLVIAVVAWFALSNKTSISPLIQPTQVTNNVTSDSGTRTFTASEVMGGFTIDVPEGFEVEETWNTIYLIKDSENKIEIFRTGTNFSSLKEILGSNPDFKERKISNTKINELEAGYETIVGRKIYYVYAPWTIYSISTSNENHFPLLDQIVRSFRFSK